MTPLHGEQTHPLKPASIAVLRQLLGGPMPSYQINPGVRDRLRREGLAAEIPGYRARDVSRYGITTAGRQRLAEIDGTAGKGVRDDQIR